MEKVKKPEHCDKLFHRYFDPWYTKEARRRRGFKATRPDMFFVKRLVGVDAIRASPLTEDGQAKTREQIATMINAARGDWQEYLPVNGEIDIQWVKAFDTYYDRTRVSDVIARSDPKDFGCDYIVLCCEFGAVMGHVMRLLQPGLVCLPKILAYFFADGLEYRGLAGEMVADQAVIKAALRSDHTDAGRFIGTT